MPDPSPRAEDDELLARCQRLLDYRFRQPSLLRAALTHASGADHRLASNERLEFLGDAILGAIVCSWLYEAYPDWHEGALTRVKSVVVSRRTCARVARRLRLQDYLVLGKGLGPAAQTPESVLAAVFEALIGALYLDGGMAAARAFIERHLRPELEAAALDQAGENHKSSLQQAAQRQFGETPTYLLLDEQGPDHSKSFKVAAQIGPRRYAPAWGPNKKDAEQRAARNALSELAGNPPPFPAD
jgi:ribonuclease-3